MEEIWKDIEWFEWKYQISNLWEVKSLNFHREWIIRILKRDKIRWNHSRVALYKNSEIKKFIVSRLVAIHFIPNPLNLPCVLHKLEDLDENGLLYNWEDNLFWGTEKDNVNDMWKKWRQNNYIGNKNNNVLWKFWKDNLLSIKVNQYTLQWEFIKQWDSMSDITRELWINRSWIYKSNKLLYASAGGFIWRY